MARKILLADDSVTAQNMGRKILTDAGYEVLTVNNGSAALKRVAEHKPDLIKLLWERHPGDNLDQLSAFQADATDGSGSSTLAASGTGSSRE